MAMKRLSDTEMFDKLTKSDCYVKTVNDADKKKVKSARAGTNPTTPSSLIAQVAVELGLRAHKAEVPAPPPPPPPPPPPAVDTTTYAPLAYNEAPGGEPSARYNVHINCKPFGNGFIDNGGRTYDDGGRCLDHRDNVHVEGLKAANMMDGKESWDPYEWMGTNFPPYPVDCYKF